MVRGWVLQRVFYVKKSSKAGINRIFSLSLGKAAPKASPDPNLIRQPQPLLWRPPRTQDSLIQPRKHKVLRKRFNRGSKNLDLGRDMGEREIKRMAAAMKRRRSQSQSPAHLSSPSLDLSLRPCLELTASAGCGRFNTSESASIRFLCYLSIGSSKSSCNRCLLRTRTRVRVRVRAVVSIGWESRRWSCN